VLPLSQLILNVRLYTQGLRYKLIPQITWKWWSHIWKGMNCLRQMLYATILFWSAEPVEETGLTIGLLHRKLIIYQMVSGNNWFQIKCCPGIINSKFHSKFRKNISPTAMRFTQAEEWQKVVKSEAGLGKRIQTASAHVAQCHGAVQVYKRRQQRDSGKQRHTTSAQTMVHSMRSNRAWSVRRRRCRAPTGSDHQSEHITRRCD